MAYLSTSVAQRAREDAYAPRPEPVAPASAFPMPDEFDAAPNVLPWTPQPSYDQQDEAQNVLPWVPRAQPQPYSPEPSYDPYSASQGVDLSQGPYANGGAPSFLRSIGTGLTHVGGMVGAAPANLTNEQWDAEVAAMHSANPLTPYILDTAQTLALGSIGNGPHLPGGNVSRAAGEGIEGVIARLRAKGLTPAEVLRDPDYLALQAESGFMPDYNARPADATTASDITVNLRRAREQDARLPSEGVVTTPFAPDAPTPQSIYERARARANAPRLPDTESQQQAIRAIIADEQGSTTVGNLLRPGVTNALGAGAGGYAGYESTPDDAPLGDKLRNAAIGAGAGLGAAALVRRFPGERGSIELGPRDKAPAPGEAFTVPTGHRTNNEIVTEFKPRTFPVGNGREIVQQWQAGNRAILDRIGNDPDVLGGFKAMVTGDLPDSFLNTALHRKALLRSAMEADGVPAPLIGEVIDPWWQDELKAHYGGKVPDSVKEMLLKAQGFGGGAEGATGLNLFVQRWKNSAFGLGDVGVFGVQVLNAIRRGGIPMLIGGVNRTLAGLNLPHIATELTNSTLPRAQQLLLDGVHQGIGSSGAAPEAGTLLSYLGRVGRAVDTRYVVPATDVLTRLQFQNVLRPLRNATYEGDLVLLKLLGRDIQNPRVRAEAAANANVLSSFAEQAVNGTRRSVESLAATSASMTRARIRSITQMARLIDPRFKGGSSAEQRILAATTIASTYGLYALVTKAINDQIGTTDVELDPSALGFGVINSKFKNAAGQHIKVDVVPQDSVERAFALSIRALQDPNVDAMDAQRAWERVALGSGSVLTRGALAAGFRTGYEPGEGYKYGNLSAGGIAQSVLPTPPIVGAIAQGSTTATELGLSAAGVSNYPDSRPTTLQPHDYQGMHGEAQLGAVKAEAWRTIRGAEGAPPDVTQFNSYTDWKKQELQRTLEKLSNAEGAPDDPDEIWAAAKKLVDKHPYTKAYDSTRKRLETQWVKDNPELTLTLFHDWQEHDKAGDTDWKNAHPDNNISQEQRDLARKTILQTSPAKKQSTRIERDANNRIAAVIEDYGTHSIRRGVERDQRGRVARVLEGEPL